MKNRSEDLQLGVYLYSIKRNYLRRNEKCFFQLFCGRKDRDRRNWVGIVWGNLRFPWSPRKGRSAGTLRLWVKFAATHSIPSEPVLSPPVVVFPVILSLSVTWPEGWTRIPMTPLRRRRRRRTSHSRPFPPTKMTSTPASTSRGPWATLYTCIAYTMMMMQSKDLSLKSYQSHSFSL